MRQLSNEFRDEARFETIVEGDDLAPACARIQLSGSARAIRVISPVPRFSRSSRYDSYDRSIGYINA